MGERARKFTTWAIAGVAVALTAIGVTAARGRPGSDPEAMAVEARQAIEARQWSRAEAILDRLSGLRAQTPADALLRADLLKGQGRASDALPLLKAIPDTDPLAARARLLAGQIERERGRIRPAEAALIEASRLGPTLIQAHRELLYIYGMQARRAALNDEFRALAGLVQLNYDDLFLWSTSHQDVWVNASIRTELERFLAADPEDRWSRLALAGVLLRSGLLDEAEATLRPLADSDVEALTLRARLALDRSRLDEARALLSVGPAGHAGLALLRGELAKRLRDWPAAAREFRTAVTLDPTSLQAARALALALKQSGDEEGAASARVKADRLGALAAILEKARPPEGPRDRTIARRLGAASEAVGLLDEARGWYLLAIEIDPLDAEAQRGLYRLGNTPR